MDVSVQLELWYCDRWFAPRHVITADTHDSNTVCGWVDDVISRHPQRPIFKDCVPRLQKNFVWRAITGMVSYAVVYAVAALNPKVGVRVCVFR